MHCQLSFLNFQISLIFLRVFSNFRLKYVLQATTNTYGRQTTCSRSITTLYQRQQQPELRRKVGKTMIFKLSWELAYFLTLSPFHSWNRIHVSFVYRRTGFPKITCAVVEQIPLILHILQQQQQILLPFCFFFNVFFQNERLLVNGKKCNQLSIRCLCCRLTHEINKRKKE